MAWRRASLATVGLLAIVIAACNSDDADNTGDPSAAETGYQGALLSAPKPKPDLTLTDTSGRAYDLRRETDGYVTLLFVGYTNCPDICPVHMAHVASTLKSMPPEDAAKVKVVFVTSDPARDTTDVLRAWLDNFDPAFVGLVPDEAELDDVTSALTMNPIQTHDLGNGAYAVDHAAYVLAFAADDNTARIGFLGGMPPEIYDNDIPRLVRETAAD